MQRAATTITATDFARRLSILSDDSLAGRKTGTPGLETAAGYVAAELKALGLRPAGGANGFVQRYPLRSYRVDVAATTLSLGAGPLVLGKDFGLAPSQKQELSAELVYAGQARDTARRLPPQVAGKLVAFSLSGAPEPSWNRIMQRVMEAGRAAGAAGIVFILDPSVGEGLFAGMRPALAGERAELPPSPVLALPSTAVAPAFAAAGQPLDSLRQALTGDAAPIATGITITLRQPLTIREESVPNVVALLRGSDPVLRDQYVVVSAHMDHVGVGRPDEHGDSIYNGADDNASGTVALLEIARAFRALPQPPARSILFLAVSGEEQGLRGSDHWVANPTIPLERVVADVNLDMVTRNAPDSIAVLGQELSSLGTTVQALAMAHPELRLTIPPGNPWPQIALIEMSDQLPFLHAGVPSVFFFSGMHPDLHRPSDELARCDTDKGARAARLAFLLAHATAQAAARPSWTEEGRRAFPPRASGN